MICGCSTAAARPGRQGAARLHLRLVHGKSYRQMVVEKINHDAKRIDALPSS
jgi:hypothetical protein